MKVFPPAKHDALFLDELLTPEEREVRDRVRRFAVRLVALVACLLSPETSNRETHLLVYY